MPQTVPKRPMNGAVDPTEARTARPDCRRAVNSSMQLRRLRVIQSLTSRLSCRCALVLRWCAVASRPSSARCRNGFDGSLPSFSMPAAKSSLCQKSRAPRACFLNLMMSSALMRMTIHEGERHAEQQHGDGPGDEITLDPYVGNAEMRFHENS